MSCQNCQGMEGNVVIVLKKHESFCVWHYTKILCCNDALLSMITMMAQNHYYDGRNDISPAETCEGGQKS